MKLFILGFAFLATAYGEYASEYQVPEDSLTQYLPPAQEISHQAPSNEYLAPISAAAPVGEIPSGALAADGYRYKTVRRSRLRHRRDVSELTQYLPPAQEHSHQAPSNEYLAPISPPAPVAEIASGVLADDGYRYKTVRRSRLRHRRDVSELTQYLPPTEEISHQFPSNEYLAPISAAAPADQVDSGFLADDGYRYKTVRRSRLRHRHRRDVSELTQYLPPTQEISYEAPSNEYLAPTLADDGYRYKTVRRFRTRRH